MLKCIFSVKIYNLYHYYTTIIKIQTIVSFNFTLSYRIKEILIEASKIEKLINNELSLDAL